MKIKCAVALILVGLAAASCGGPEPAGLDAGSADSSAAEDAGTASADARSEDGSSWDAATLDAAPPPDAAGVDARVAGEDASAPVADAATVLPDAAAISPDAATISPDDAAIAPDAAAAGPDAAGLDASQPILVKITVTPTNPMLNCDGKLQFNATGLYSDQSVSDLTPKVTWSSSNPGIVTIDQNGLATGHNIGAAMITAALGTVQGSTTVVLICETVISCTVLPPSATVAVGGQVQFSVTASYPDGSVVDVTQSASWTSGDATIATVENGAAGGRATGQGPGQTSLTASIGTISCSTSLAVSAGGGDAGVGCVDAGFLVSIAVTPPNPAMAPGCTQPLAALGTYATGATQDITGCVAWSTDSPQVATVDQTGLSTAATVGTTLARAALDGREGQTTLAVMSPDLYRCTVEPADAAVAVGGTQQFVARVWFADCHNSSQIVTDQASWSSSDPAMASVGDSAGSCGLATGLVPGLVTITANVASRTCSASLTVTP